MLNLLLDTNVFLHGKFFKDVAWDKEMAAGLSVCIVVPYPVIRELDQKKYSGKTSAIRSRAEQVVSALLELTGDAAKDQAVPLRTNVSLKVLTKQAPFEPSDDLDASDQDDRVIADCLWLLRASIDVKVCSRDVGLLLKAKARDIPNVRLPKSLCEEVQDSAVKELAQIKNSRPELTPSLLVRGERVVPGGTVRYELVENARMEVVQRLTWHLEQQLEAEGRSQYDHELLGNYYAEEHRNYSRERTLSYQRELLEYATKRQEHGRLVPFDVAIHNKGKVPARNVRAALRADGLIDIVSKVEPLIFPQGLEELFNPNPLAVRALPGLEGPFEQDGVSAPQILGREAVFKVVSLGQNLTVLLSGAFLKIRHGFSGGGGSLLLTLQSDEIGPIETSFNFRVEGVVVQAFVNAPALT